MVNHFKMVHHVGFFCFRWHGKAANPREEADGQDPCAHSTIIAALEEVAMFSDWFGTLEIESDATAYFIVRACRKLGFQAPEDVRWCQEEKRRQGSGQAG